MKKHARKTSEASAGSKVLDGTEIVHTPNNGAVSINLQTYDIIVSLSDARFRRSQKKNNEAPQPRFFLV